MDASDDFKERITIPERDGFATREENVCIIYRSVNMRVGTYRKSPDLYTWGRNVSQISQSVYMGPGGICNCKGFLDTSVLKDPLIRDNLIQG